MGEFKEVIIQIDEIDGVALNVSIKNNFEVCAFFSSGMNKTTAKYASLFTCWQNTSEVITDCEIDAIIKLSDKYGDKFLSAVSNAALRIAEVGAKVKRIR
jgi:hypothetical protein